MRIPPLSIALLTYNRSRYLRQALDAILAQTYQDYELLVLDNGSTDDTAEMVLAHRDPRLTYVRNPDGNGPEYNGACAQWFSRGRRLMCAHDDDIMEPTLVERQMAWMDANPRLRGVASNLSIIDEEGRIVQPKLRDFKGDKLFERGEYLPYYLREKFPLPISGFMTDVSSPHADRKASTSYFKSIKPDEVFLAGDVYFECLLNTEGPIGILGDPLLRYRLHREQSSQNIDLVTPELDLMMALRRHVKVNPWVARQAPGIEAAILRYKAQGVILDARSLKDLPQARRRLGTLQSQWMKRVVPRNRVQDIILPFEILALHLGLGTTLPASATEARRWPVTDDATRLAFRT